MFITIPVSHSCGIWFLSVILLNSSSNCILNLFPPNFHSSIGRLSNSQLFLFFVCLSTSFSSSILLCLCCRLSLRFSSPLLFLLHLCYLAHSRVFHSILSIPFLVSGQFLVYLYILRSSNLIQKKFFLTISCQLLHVVLPFVPYKMFVDKILKGIQSRLCTLQNLPFSHT